MLIFSVFVSPQKSQDQSGIICSLCGVDQKLLHQPLLLLLISVLPIMVLARPLVCWISVNKDALDEFHWLFELQSRSSRKCGNEESESQSEGKRIERKMAKNLHSKVSYNSCLAEVHHY